MASHCSNPGRFGLTVQLLKPCLASARILVAFTLRLLANAFRMARLPPGILPAILPGLRRPSHDAYSPGLLLVQMPLPFCLACPAPPRFVWPSVRFRIEDGAGTCSSAYWQVPRERDSFKNLRQAWVRPILQPGFIPSVLSRLNSDSKAPPLSQEELIPFFWDLRDWLQISTTLSGLSFWRSMLASRSA